MNAYFYTIPTHICRISLIRLSILRIAWDFEWRCCIYSNPNPTFCSCIFRCATPCFLPTNIKMWVLFVWSYSGGSIHVCILNIKCAQLCAAWCQKHLWMLHATYPFEVRDFCQQIMLEYRALMYERMNAVERSARCQIFCNFRRITAASEPKFILCVLNWLYVLIINWLIAICLINITCAAVSIRVL